MMKNADNSVVFSAIEFEQLYQVIRKMHLWLDEIPSNAAPSIKIADIEQIDHWKSLLEKVRKDKTR